MILQRVVLGRVLGWCALAGLLFGGLAALASAVESVRLGLIDALHLAALSLPAALVVLAPALCAVGAATASARMASLGERLAVACAGISPLRSAVVAIGAGLLLGLGAQAAGDHLVWRAAASQQRIVPHEPVAWVWLEDGALRERDGAWVGIESGQITALGHRTIDPETIRQARMQQQPRLASAAALRRSPLASAALERHSRRARVLACAALAGLAWLPIAGGLRQVGAALAIAIGWQAIDLLLYAAAAQGRLALELGGWGGAGVATIALVVRLLRLR